MRTYTLKTLRDFRDKYTKEDYSKGKELVNIEEERALELLSSDNSLVKYVSHIDDNNDVTEVENIKKELEEVKTQVETLKVENDALKAENETLKADNDAMLAENESLKADNDKKTTETDNKKQNK